ncbi:glycosyltransferase [Paraburkholderia sp. J94]|uniref:glycosyltransferase n=1 Tax=Paraburkholderia sp. J94 TaxID=2805441 RepID=UPI002AB0E2E3|nr:glycosyltransferase [Paraburkholderia sp. J94]
MNQFRKKGADISIILPRYNESSAVMLSTIRKINEIRRHCDVQLIIVNDCSVNDYYDIQMREIRGMDEGVTLISNGGNFGKGYSVRRGVDLASGNFIFYSDIDFPVGVDDFLVAYKRMRDNAVDMIIGERYSLNSIRANSYRSVGSRVFLKLYNKLFDSSILDTQCPFKIFKCEVAKEIFANQRLNGYAFDAEILYLAKIFRRKIGQISINWQDTRENWRFIKTSVNYGKMIFDLLFVRMYWGVKGGLLNMGVNSGGER